MSPLRDTASGFTRAWTAAYTRGLPGEAKYGRRAEIASDLWEQQRSADAYCEAPLATAATIFARWLLGIPADITWRVQAGRSARAERRIKMNDSLLMRALLLLGMAAPAFLVVVAGQVIAGETSDGATGLVETAYFIGLITSAVAIGAGLIVSRGTPRLGIGLVALGTIAASALMFWVAIFTVPIGIALAAIAYFRGKRTGWPRGVDNRPPTGTATA